MFCSKCGYKISKGSRICSNCQTPVSETEVCGGFWGLVGNNKQDSPSSPDFPVPESGAYNKVGNESFYQFDQERYEKEKQEEEASKQSGKGGIFPILTGLFFAAFLIAVGFGMFRSSTYKKELARKDTKIEKLQKENAGLREERDTLKAENEDKDGQIENLQKSMAGKIDDNVNDFQKDLHERIQEDYKKVTDDGSTEMNQESPSTEMQ